MQKTAEKCAKVAESWCVLVRLCSLTKISPEKLRNLEIFFVFSPLKQRKKIWTFRESIGYEISFLWLVTEVSWMRRFVMWACNEKSWKISRSNHRLSETPPRSFSAAFYEIFFNYPPFSSLWHSSFPKTLSDNLHLCTLHQPPAPAFRSS